ncbi:hypothetical protein [Promicromonospora sp. AC04]|uniref:hypothetical protein n=1 Tax=Promicromonospora sp. AC04 TaxID=2135723 RepID=UPI0011B2557B|nr:hypothetical protein [Promicromonospora sp. AC04]
MWLELFRDDVESFVREGARQRFNALNQAVSVGAMSGENETVKDSAKFLDRLHADFDVKHFQRVCESLVGGETTYLHYRIASNYVHPSLYQADLYLAEADSASGIEFVTNARLSSADAWLGMATSFLVSGCLAWERVDRERLHSVLLKGYARELGISPRRPEMTNEGFLASSKADRARRERARQRRKSDRGDIGDR